MESCDGCVKYKTKVERLTVQNRKILDTLKILNAAKKHKEQFIDSTLEFIKSKDEDYKKEKLKIKELAIRVKNTTAESVLRNIPKQIDEINALFIQKSNELQNYAKVLEMARVAKLELETKTLELDGNRMYVKQLIADADQERAKNKMLNESLTNAKQMASKAGAKLRKMERQCAMLNSVHLYQAKVEAGVKKAMKKLEADDPNSTKNCLKILQNLVSYFTLEPLFGRIKKESGESSKDVDSNDSPHSVSSGYSSGTGSPWTTPYNTHQSEQLNTEFTFSFTPDGNFVLSPAPPPQQTTSGNTCASNMMSTSSVYTDTNSTRTDANSTSLSNTPNQYSITSPCVTSVFSPPQQIESDSITAASEMPVSSCSMECGESYDDETCDVHQDETDNDESDKELLSRGEDDKETLTTKLQDISDFTENRLNRDGIKTLPGISIETSRNKSVGHKISQNTLESQKTGIDISEETEMTYCKKRAITHSNSKSLEVDSKTKGPTDISADDTKSYFDVKMEPLGDDDTDSDSGDEEQDKLLTQRLANVSSGCTDEILQLPNIGFDDDCDSKSEVNKKKDVKTESNKDKTKERSSDLDEQETKRLAMFGTKSAKKTQSIFSPKSQQFSSQVNKKETKKETQKELSRAAKLLEKNLFEDILSEKEETPVDNSKRKKGSVSLDFIDNCTKSTTEFDNSCEVKGVEFPVANSFPSSSLSDDESVDLENGAVVNNRLIEKSVTTVEIIKKSTCSKRTDGKINDSTVSGNCQIMRDDEKLKTRQSSRNCQRKSTKTQTDPLESDLSLETKETDMPVAKDEIPFKRHSLRNLDKSQKPSDEKQVVRRSTRKSNNLKESCDKSVESDHDENSLEGRLPRKTGRPQKTCEDKSQKTPLKRQSLRQITTRNSSKLESSLNEDIVVSSSIDLETSLSDNESITLENAKGGSMVNDSSIKDIHMEADENAENYSEETCDEKKEPCDKRTTRQSKRKSSNTQEPCDGKLVSDANNPPMRRQSMRKKGNSQKICYENPESDDEKPVTRQSARTRKTVQKSSDAEKPTGLCSLRKLDKKSDERGLDENEEKRPGRCPSLRSKTTRNSSKVDNSLTENVVKTIEKDAETPSKNVASVNKVSPFVLDETIDNKLPVVKDETNKAKGEISVKIEAESDNIEEFTDSESLLNEDVMKIFKDMEVIKNITIVENLTASPCKRNVKSGTTNPHSNKLSESSSLSESSDSEHIVPNEILSYRNHVNLDLNEDTSDIDKTNVQSEEDPLSRVKDCNYFEYHVDQNVGLELEKETSEVIESSIKTEHESSSEMVEEDPLEIVNKTISQQKINTNRMEENDDNIENNTSLMYGKTNENGPHHKIESNAASLKTLNNGEASHNLCSLDKFNKTSKTIISSPVVFVSSAATEVPKLKVELLDKSKDDFTRSNFKEPPSMENKAEHPKINSKPIDEMRKGHVPIYCALDRNRPLPDPTQRNKGMKKLIPNPIKFEATGNTETQESEAFQSKSIQRLSPTPVNVEANEHIRTKKSRVAHSNKKSHDSSLEKSIESKKPEQYNFENAIGIVEGSPVEKATKKKTPVNGGPKNYNCNLNLVKPNIVGKQASPVNDTCNLDIVKVNPIQKLLCPVVKNKEPSIAVDTKSNSNGVKATTIHKEPSLVVNSKRIKQILKKMKLLEKYPFIDPIPPTPPLSLSNGTGFKNQSGYSNRGESKISQEKLLEKTNPRVEMPECLSKENGSFTEDSCNQNINLNPKVEMTEEDKSEMEGNTNEGLVDTISDKTCSHVSNVSKVENVDRNDILEASPNFSTVIENFTCEKKDNLNSSCGEESEVEHGDLVIESDNEESSYSCNRASITTNLTKTTEPSSTFNLGLSTNSSNLYNDRYCDKLMEPHNTTLNGYFEEPNSSFSTLWKSPIKVHLPQSVPTATSTFPKCIQARLSAFGSRSHLPICNVNVMDNIAHNTRQTPKLDEQMETNPSNMASLIGAEKTNERSINSYTHGFPVPNQAGLHHADFGFPSKATTTTIFYGQKSTNHLNTSHGNYKEETNSISTVNPIDTSPNKDNMEAIAKPINNDFKILPTLSFYNSTSSVASPSKRKCENDISEGITKKQKTDGEAVIANNVENIVDANTIKDYSLLKRTMEHVQEQIDTDKPATKNSSNKALEGKLNSLFHTLHVKDKVAFDKKIKQIAIEISVNPFETLSRTFIAMFDKDHLIDKPKEMSITFTKVFCTILEVLRHQPEFLPVFMKTIHETIALHCETTMLSVTDSLVKLYVSLCRWRNDAASVMTLLYDAIYFHKKRAINIMDAVLTRWPSVYPVGSRCVRVKVMSVILLNQQNHGYSSHNQTVFVKTKQALRMKYRYREQYTYRSLLEELMVMLRDEQKCVCDARCNNQWNNSNMPPWGYNPNDNTNWRSNNSTFRGHNSTDNSSHQRAGQFYLPSFNCCVGSALILLAKHWTPAELYSVVVDSHLATLFRSSLDSGRLSVAATCAEIIGMIGKAMPRGLSIVCSLSMLDTLEAGLRHPACPPLSAARLSIARAIAWLASHNTERVLDILSSVAWSDAEVNELFEHVATKVIMVKNFDWWKASLERLQGLPSVDRCQATSDRRQTQVPSGTQKTVGNSTSGHQ